MSGRPIIVVGTGRCGSTLLSQIVRAHPDVLSVSEVFSFVTDLGARIERAFPLGCIDGRQFWQILAQPQPRQSILLENHRQMAEVVYPLHQGRFSPNALPPILQAMVPHVEPGQPDELFDSLSDEVATWPAAPVADHYRRLFQSLAGRFGKRQWVERSGGSLRVVERLIDAFPEAGIVHLVRDGRDTALSMSRHIGFRMAMLCGLQTEILGVDPYECSDRSDEADLSEELVDTLPENFTADAFDRFDLPSALCAHYWSGEIVSGLKALERVPSSSLLTMRYEDLIADPAYTMQRMCDFAGYGAPARWVAEASAMVRNEQPRWPQLPPEEQRDLLDACGAGFDALERIGIGWTGQ